MNFCLQQSCHRGNAGCAAQLPQQAVDAGRIGAEFRAKAGKGERAQRGEKEADTNSLDCARCGQPESAPIGWDSRHQHESRRGDDDSYPEQCPVIDPVDQVMYGQHRRHGRDAAR